jgi:hypothetical protein
VSEKIAATASIVEVVAAPIDRVWNLLSDFTSILRRTPGIKDFMMEGSGEGAIRSFRIGDGPLIRERLETLDGANFRFTYSVLPPAFLEDYIGEVKLSADGADACLVTWSGRCSVASRKEADERRIFFEGVFRNGIDWVRKELAVD